MLKWTPWLIVTIVIESEGLHDANSSNPILEQHTKDCRCLNAVNSATLSTIGRSVCTAHQAVSDSATNLYERSSASSRAANSSPCMPWSLHSAASQSPEMLSPSPCALSLTGDSVMRKAVRETMRGKIAVMPNTPRVPKLSMSEPLK